MVALCFWSENILFAILRLILSKGHYCALSSTIGQLDHFEGPAFIFGGKVMINPLSTIIRETLHLITRTPITTWMVYYVRNIEFHLVSLSEDVIARWFEQLEGLF